MKTRILLGAVVAALTLTSFAADTLLSPRAAGNQIKMVKSSVETPVIMVTYVDSTSARLSPRAQASQNKVVKGEVVDRNPALACRNNMPGSPKAVAECRSHATMPGCVTVALVK